MAVVDSEDPVVSRSQARPSISFPRHGPAWPRPDSPFAWALAIGLVVVASFAKPLLDNFAGSELPPYITYYPIVVLAAFCGGPRTGIAIALLTLLLAWFFFLPYPDSFSIDGRRTLLTLIVYSLTSTFLAWAAGSARLQFDAAIANERRRDYIAKESVHRIKNLLAVVQSITLKVSREVQSVEDFRDIVMERLRALDIAQEVLIRQDWQDVGMDELVRSSLAPFLPNPALHVEQGPEIVVPARYVSGLCLALFELATNSAKYGALAEVKGPVTLTWSKEDGATLLEWEERTRIGKYEEESFGTDLIRAALARDADTEIEYSMRPDGVSARFRWRD